MIKLPTSYRGKLDRGTLVTINISDLHFGAIAPDVQYGIIKEQFINEIKRLPMIDLICIIGDIFERKVMADSDVAMYASLFIEDVREVAINVGATVIVIKGTAQHDADQLKLFYHYLNDPEFDIRIVETIKFEYVKNVKILCIPELYGVEEQIYSNLLFESGMYDMCLMHGTFEGVVYGNNAGAGRLFVAQDFINCLGPIMCGHVHTGGCFARDLYYCGTPIRYKFGEEEEKGFIILLYNLDTREYYPHFIPIHSFRYVTVNLDHLVNSDPSVIVKEIEALKADGIDHLRIEITSQIPSETIGVIKEYFHNDKTIKFKQQTQTGLKEDKKEANALTEEYSYIFDKTMSPYEILARFINSKQNEIILTADKIKELVEEDI